jgi:hypothetical protein
MPSTKKSLPELKFGNVVLCEHVVLGDNSKVTLINNYAGDILVAELPASLMFGFYGEHIAEADYQTRNMTVEFVLGGAEHARVEIVMSGGLEGLPAIIAVPFFQISVPSAMDIEVFTQADGFARTRILRKSISVPPDPTALRRPA